MPSDRSLVEREIERVELHPFTLDGFHRRRQRKDRNRRIVTAVVALLVAVVAIGGLLRAFSSSSVPADDPRLPFLGAWVVETDADGSRATMIVGASGGGAIQIELHDDVAPACAGARSTMTGTGEIRGATELVIPSPDLTCDDGTEPDGLYSPTEEELHDFTFVYQPAVDSLLDPSGDLWLRLEPLGDASAGAMPGTWPQTTPEEIREAQRLADEGDPDYTWQVDPELLATGSGADDDTEIVRRFLREQLGWEAFVQNPYVGWDAYGGLLSTTFIRCAPGQTNALYPDDPRAGACASTIDGVRYETVSVDLAQPGVRGPSGLWVVTGWRTFPPFQQRTPPSEAEAAALLDGFLAARVAGEGAGGYLLVEESDIPLMYATSTGAPYERSGFERLSSPAWPDGETVVKVRLFADGGETVVEQVFGLHRAEDGSIELEYLPDAPEGPGGTTEDGQTVGEPYRILDGEVTFSAARPWRPDLTGWLGDDLLLEGSDQRFEVAADPRPSGTRCEDGPALTDAAALARTIRSDPDLEVTAPVATSVGGVEGLRMDVVPAPGARVCDGWVAVTPVVSETGVEPGSRMRLYLLDLPGGSARILAVAIVAPADHFEQVVDAATPILDSFEFHTG
jgi:hypothetical protein